MAALKSAMIVTRTISSSLPLLLLCQIASSASNAQAAHPLSSNSGDIFDKTLEWNSPPALGTEYNKYRAKWSQIEDRDVDDGNENEAARLSPSRVSIIDDPLVDFQLDAEANPKTQSDHPSELSSSSSSSDNDDASQRESKRGGGASFHLSSRNSPTRIRHHRYTRLAESTNLGEAGRDDGGADSTYAAAVAPAATGKPDRFWHNNRFHQHTDWCSKDCESATHLANHHHHHHHANGYICASDGRLYRSMCELKRHSCRHNVRLKRRPRTFCPEQLRETVAATTNMIDTVGTTTASPSPLSSSPSSSSSSVRDRVRIVELRKLCDAERYTQMKQLMYDEFNGDLRSMFEHYDVDADQYIEAHELWPRTKENGAKLIYAQVWDNHTTKCPQNNENNHGDHSKCWYFLDFAFQPQYPKNPCSLSHLMLFDLRHPSHRFDYENFAEAFSNFSSSQIGNGNYTDIADHDATDRLVKKELTRIAIGLGDNIDLKCRGDLQYNEKNHVIKDNNYLNANYNHRATKCMWSRYNSNLAALRDPHISISELRWENERERFARSDPRLHITEAQLYLSGHYKCICHLRDISLEHTYHVQVLAQPRVEILPRFQWSLPKSRISFECKYDQINTNSNASDTRPSSNSDQFQESRVSLTNTAIGADNQVKFESQFGLEVEWIRANKSLNQLSHLDHTDAYRQARRRELSLEKQLLDVSTNNKDSFYDEDSAIESDEDSYQDDRQESCNSSLRMSITAAASRLTLESLQPCDSGLYTCRVGLPQRSSLNPSVPIFSQDEGRLLVQDKPKDDGDGNFVPSQSSDDGTDVSTLWILHESGISVYKIQNDDGQEMELLREINGHSAISAEVEGNWNQLTLCGGLNSEQAVICEWSDNAVAISVGDNNNRDDNDSVGGRGLQSHRNARRKYVYVGQPNLNRVVVFDSFKFEIVAIINTEPQPRRLHLYKPNKIHLSKWVRRRLSPIANVRWESAIGAGAHSLESTPQESRLYSSKLPSSSLGLGTPTTTATTGQTIDGDDETTNSNVNQTTITDGLAGGNRGRTKRATLHINSVVEPPLVQHDIWLLCYGQPLDAPDSSASLASRRRQRAADDRQAAEQGANSSSSSSGGPRLNDVSVDTNEALPRLSAAVDSTVKPFEPRLTGAGGLLFPPFAWPANIWLPTSNVARTSFNTNNNNVNINKEARLRNRKSVHIIQSTFLPISRRRANDVSTHWHPGGGHQQQQPRTNFTVVDEFKQSSVISTHHIYLGSGSSRGTLATNHFHFTGSTSPSPLSPLQRISLLAAGRRHYDLIQDLFVPQRPYSVERNSKFQIHHAYVTHYDERRLFRVSMDNYRYDQQIDLQDCDPIHMLALAQGLVVIQCRAPISHSLIGQLVLDQLTASRIEFSANIRAQQSYPSPDNRYLVSIFHNTTSFATVVAAANEGDSQRPAEATNPESNNNDLADASSMSSSLSSASSSDQSRAQKLGSSQTQHHSSIVYVQTVTLDGLRLQYEIKTMFEISQCSFVWKDGYYAAIFVTTNRKDRQSEILSLRLIDGRLELVARVSGLVSSARHKEQLIVAPELRLAALTTDQGTFVVDLEENRVSQSLRRHLSPPTLLWV